MKYKPRDYGIPADYKHWHGDKAEDFLGPFFFRVDEEGIRTAFRADKRHCNAHDSVHGGILMAFADYTLCLAANGGAEESVATVTCNNEFIAPAAEGDLIEGRSEVVKRGGSLVFVRGELSVNGSIVLTSSGVIKRIRSH
ncbi:MAG: hypothetical protein RLZZ385_1605 [Pseudomonadota bacterium]|jgi:uncharacterized protein (TIGR00369 family)